MKLDIFRFQDIIEQRLKLAALINNSRHQFRSRFVLDPISSCIVDAVPRYHKLEVMILALTLLRYSDVLKFNIHDFLSGSSQEILQGKTKESITIPPLFLSHSSHTAVSFPSVSIFTDGYDKLRYSLKCSIPKEIRSQLDTSRSVTHIFRFLRSTYYYITDKDYFKVSKYLGHKDPESVKSYVPPELLNLYSLYLSKG